MHHLVQARDAKVKENEQLLKSLAFRYVFSHAFVVEEHATVSISVIY